MGSALGITKKRKADVAWLFTDSSLKATYALQHAMPAVKDSSGKFYFAEAKNMLKM